MPEDINNLNDAEKAELERLINKVENGSTNPTPAVNESDDRKFGEAPTPNPATVKRLLDPADWVKKQVDTLTAVGRENYLTGIKSPRKDPIKAGIAAQAKYEAKMKDEKVLKNRVTGLKNTNMDEWTAMCESLGADKLVDGVVKRKYKIERFVGKWTPLLKAHLDKIDAMPDVTDSDREKKMIENVKGLKALKGKA